MSKKIVFMGTPDYATKIFDTLLKSKYDIVSLFTQPDKKVGRKQLLTPPHIKKYCLDNSLDIPIHQPEKLRNNEEIVELITSYKPDFIIVAAYGQILPKEILDIAPCINLHASLLPKYRGASPIQEALLNSDEYTGVTSMLMEEGLDSGDVLGLKYYKVPFKMEVAELFENLSNLAADLTIETLDLFDNINPQQQIEAQVSYCKKIKKDHGEIKFDDAMKLYSIYKAYSYWPGVFISNGLKLKDITFNEYDSKNIEGEIKAIENDYITIACKKGTLNIKTLQAPSKKAVCSVDYIRGQRLSVGDILL